MALNTGRGPTRLKIRRSEDGIGAAMAPTRVRPALAQSAVRKDTRLQPAPLSGHRR